MPASRQAFRRVPEPTILARGNADEHGILAAEGKVHTHDLHAKMLPLLGIDHEKLTYHYAGRDYRLTDVAGEVVKPILA
jgi:hypothetical protein